MTPSPQPPASPQRRHVWWAVALLGLVLIPAARVYRADRTAGDGGNQAVQSRQADARDAMPTAIGPPASPVEAWHEPTPPTGVDASNFYKNAFVLYAALTDEEKKMLRPPVATLDPDIAAALFKKIQPILDLLRQAAAADYCAWGLGEISYDTALPHLSKAHDLGRLASWSAGYRFPSDPQGALADLQAQARLGDHLADTLIGWLVQISMEASASKVLRQNAGVLDDAQTAQALALIQSSTVERNAARAFAAEAASMDAIIKKLAAPKPAERTQLLQMLNDAGGDSASRAIFELLVQDEAARAAESRYVQQIQRQMAEAILWPDAQYQAWWQAVESSLPAHPLAALTLPTLTGVRARLQLTQVEQTMLGAGLTLLQSGPEQLARFRDPLTGTAFGYVEKPDGFELQSTFERGGQPVTMSFTRPK